MNHTVRSCILFLTAALVTFWLSAAAALAAPAGSSFTYQGRLADNGTAADGNFDFTVSLHTAADSPAALAQLSTAEVPVVDGVFTLSLDFGSAAFDGTARWIEIQVLKSGETGTPAVLTPRQEISPTPYALMALKVPDGSITSP